MFNFIKNIFTKKPSKNDFVDKDGNLITRSSLYNLSNTDRFLRLSNSSCAIVIHEDNSVEVIFTKAYDPENQSITENEESLMALALFMKQPGFLEMIIDEFRKVAKDRIKNLTEDK